MTVEPRHGRVGWVSGCPRPIESPVGRHPRDSTAYRLRQKLNAAVRELRDAEDIARMEIPGYPTADRIRDIYEQVSEDVLNGQTTKPPLLQRLREAEAELAQARRAM